MCSLDTKTVSSSIFGSVSLGVAFVAVTSFSVIFQLVDLSCCNDFGVNSFQDLFAFFVDIKFGRIY